MLEKYKKLTLIGGSGFIGSEIGEYFSNLGWILYNFTRKSKIGTYSYPCKEILWDGRKIDPKDLEDSTCIINLSGENIAKNSWTKENKEIIKNSRVNSTKALAQAIEEMKNPPKIVLQSSAIGFYGMKTREIECNEHSTPGVDFLSKLAHSWENSAKSIEKKTRLVTMRIGVVLGWGGGAFPKLYDIYASALGAKIGSGSQWMNWIHIDDLIRFIEYSIENNNVKGPYNLVAPGNITNKEFHQIMSRNSKSFNLMTTPKLFLSLAMGEKSTLISKAPKVVSTRLKDFNQFKYPFFLNALENLLSKKKFKDLFYISFKQWVPQKIERVWDFVSKAENLEKITPPWLNFKIDTMSDDKIKKGTKINYSLKLHGIPIKWRSNISTWKPKSEFVDHQEKGPYKVWYHRHLFKEIQDGTLIEDRIDYTLPFFPFGQAAFPFVKNDLIKIFEYRKKATFEEVNKN